VIQGEGDEGGKKRHYMTGGAFNCLNLHYYNHDFQLPVFGVAVG